MARKLSATVGSQVLPSVGSVSETEHPLIDQFVSEGNSYGNLVFASYMGRRGGSLVIILSERFSAGASYLASSPGSRMEDSHHLHKGGTPTEVISRELPSRLNKKEGNCGRRKRQTS